MKKISKSLLVSAIALALGVINIVPALAISDGGTGDLNNRGGEVADKELVRIVTTSTFTLDVSGSGLVSTIDANGVTTALSGSYATKPADMSIATPGTQADSYSNQIIKGNGQYGYKLYLMMCNVTAGTNYATAVTDCKDGNVLDDTTTGGVVVKPVGFVSGTSNNGAANAALTGTTDVNTGGFWGYRSSSTYNGGSAAAAPSGSYNPVPLFSDTTPYGDVLVNTTAAGAAAANVSYSVVTNSALPQGTYSNYVIYTAVANVSP